MTKILLRKGTEVSLYKDATMKVPISVELCEKNIYFKEDELIGYTDDSGIPMWLYKYPDSKPRYGVHTIYAIRWIQDFDDFT